MAKQAVAVRLTPEMIGAVDALAKKLGASRQQVLESFVAGGLDDSERGVPDLVQEAPQKVEPVTPQVNAPSLLGLRQARLAKEMGWSK